MPAMIRVTTAVAFAAILGVAATVASTATSVSGVVIGAQTETKSLFVADSQGRVFLVLAPRLAPVGATVRVRGDASTPAWTIVATGSDGSIARTGSAASALVHGQLGFVDIAKRRFQLGAHGQVVGEVSFPSRFGTALLRLGIGPPQPRSLSFRLAIRHGRLSLAALPR
jgi:hypothetical protein